MTVPFDEVEKVFTQSDMMSGDVSPHIAPRSLVRVLRGIYQHRQGVVSQKHNQGRELIVMDPDNNEKVSSPHPSQSDKIFKSHSLWSQKIKSRLSGFSRILQGRR